MSDDRYIESTSQNPELLKDGTPAWSVSIIKSRGEVVAIASEGASHASEAGLSYFTVKPFSCRRVEVRSGAHRMTQKVKDQLLASIKSKLIAEGLAPAEAAAAAA